MEVIQDVGSVKVRWNHKAGETLRLAVDADDQFRFGRLHTHSLGWGTVPTRAKLDRPSRISVIDLNPEAGAVEVNFASEYPSIAYAEAGDPLSHLWTPKGQSGFQGVSVYYRRGEEPWRLIQSGNADSTLTRIPFFPDHSPIRFFRTRNP